VRHKQRDANEMTNMERYGCTTEPTFAIRR
jgi:hypothetical protein